MSKHDFSYKECSTYCLGQHGLIVVYKAVCHAEDWHQSPINFTPELPLFIVGPRVVAGVGLKDFNSLIVMDSVDTACWFDIVRFFCMLHVHINLLDILVIWHVSYPSTDCCSAFLNF